MSYLLGLARVTVHHLESIGLSHEAEGNLLRLGSLAEDTERLEVLGSAAIHGDGGLHLQRLHGLEDRGGGAAHTHGRAGGDGGGGAEHCAENEVIAEMPRDHCDSNDGNETIERQLMTAVKERNGTL